MTPKEFKAWFDGFTEALEGTPSVKQWARIKERVAEIDGTPTTYPVYISGYWRPYRRYLDDYSIYFTSSNSTGLRTTSGGAGDPVASAYYTAPAEDLTPKFDSNHAMYALGKADVEAMS